MDVIDVLEKISSSSASNFLFYCFGFIVKLNFYHKNLGFNRTVTMHDINKDIKVVNGDGCMLKAKLKSGQ